MQPQQSVLSPSGLDAAAIASLSWVMFAGAAAVLVGVVALAACAWCGSPALRRHLSGNSFILVGGAVFPTVALTGLLIYGLILTGDRVGATEPDALLVEVTGEQWWWRVRYPAREGASEVATANEIYIPVGRPVEIRLGSSDVIHSFWAPSLAGKVDMIPGVTNRLGLRATKAGVFRGQCAEYCGGPHALMAFHVVALEASQFNEWLAGQRRPATAAVTPAQKKGQGLFMAAGCGGCHTIRGTSASGTIGPDLTHVGERLSIAAGALPAGARSFARWIGANQHIKPNNRMPEFANLSPDELEALAEYLDSLK